MKIFKKGNYYFKYNKLSNEYILDDDNTIRFDSDTFNQDLTDYNIDYIINSIIDYRIKDGNNKILNIKKDKKNILHLNPEEIKKSFFNLKKQLNIESFKNFYLESNSIKSVTCSHPTSGKGHPII